MDAASALTPRPESWTSIATCESSSRVVIRTQPSGSCRVGGIFQQIGENSFHEVDRRVNARPALVEREAIGRLGVRGLEQRHPLAHERVDIDRFRVDRRLACELRERANAALQHVDFADDNLNRGVHECAIGRRLPGEHLLNGQANRRQRVLQLVGGLSRERLPARHLGQIHQPLAGCDRSWSAIWLNAPTARPTSSSRFVSSRRSQSPAAKPVNPAVSC